MFLKLLVENCDGQTPIIELGEEALVIELKLELEEITGAPGEGLLIQFRGRMLDDHDLIYKVHQEYQDLDMPATGEAQHNTDFVVIYRTRVLCRLKFVDGCEACKSNCGVKNNLMFFTNIYLEGSSSTEQLCDLDFMDAECHTQSSKSTKRRNGRGSVFKLWSKVVTWLFKKRQ